MAQAKPTTYTLSLNKLVIGGFIILLLGGGIHFGLQKVGVLSSSASGLGSACSAQATAMSNNLEDLMAQLSTGVALDPDQIQFYREVVAEYNQCMQDIRDSKSLAIK